MEDKGKKGTKDASKFAEQAPYSSIGPEEEDGQGTILSIKKKLAKKKAKQDGQGGVGSFNSLGDLASHARSSIKGAMGAIKATGAQVSNNLSNNNPLKRVKGGDQQTRSAITGIAASKYTGSDKSASQPVYGTLKKKVQVKSAGPIRVGIKSANLAQRI